MPTAGWERGDQKRSRAHSPADKASSQGEKEVQQDSEETIRKRRRYSRIGKRRSEGGGGTAGLGRYDQEEEVQQGGEETIRRRRRR